jgi:predicted nucleic acid-binding protein
MTHYFFDSSALVKRYLRETGSTWVQSVTTAGSGNTIMIAEITPIEIMSAVNRQQRDGKIKARITKAIRLLIERHGNRQYITVSMSVIVIKRAKDLLEKQPLRAYDSVQLASAIESNIRLISAGLRPLVFVSSDTRLLNIASIETLSIDDPANHP